MAQRLKRWESHRREGRNDKGKGGSARQRQRRKQFQMLRQRLKDQSAPPASDQQKINQAKPTGESNNASPVLLYQGCQVPDSRGQVSSSVAG